MDKHPASQHSPGVGQGGGLCYNWRPDAQAEAPNPGDPAGAAVGEAEGRAPSGPGKLTWRNPRIKAVQLRLAEPAQLSSRCSLLPD